jgi:FkbM family methyltransferase
MKTFLKRCRWGQMLLLRGDMVSEYADLYGEWQELEVVMFRDILRPQSNVIEVGAHIGMHSVPLSRIASRGQVICFEPQRIIHQILAANCALNNCTNVHTEHMAVGDYNGEVDIPCSTYDEAWNYGSFSVVEGFNTEGQFKGEQWMEKVRVTRLDDHPLAASLNALRLLKVDAEGMEVNVLDGAEELIRRHRPCLFVENNRAETGDLLIQKIESLGYDSYWFCSKRFSPHNFNGETKVVEGGDYNMVCFPREGRVDPGSLIRVKEFADLANGRVSYLSLDKPG